MYLSLLEEVYTFLVGKMGVPDFNIHTETVNLVPLSNIDYQDKIRGAMISLAIGDIYRNSTILLTESLVINQTFNPEDLANRFTRQPIYEADKVMKQFIVNYKNNKLDWYGAGTSSLDSGAVVRGLPIALINYGDFYSLRLIEAIQTMITHMNETAIAAGILFSTAITYLLNTPAFCMQNKEDINLFIDTMCKSIKGIETKVYSIGKNGEIGNLYTIVNRILREWLEKELSVEEVMNLWDSSNNILATIPLSIYTFLKNPSDYEKTLKEYVRPRGNDAISTMTLILLGAYLGYSNIPKGCINKSDIKKELLTLSDRLFELSLKNKSNNPYRRMKDQIEIERSQDELDRLLWLGIKYNKEEEYESAVKCFEELTVKGFDFKKNERIRLHIIEAYEGLGTKLLDKEYYEEALKYYKKALVYDINHPAILCDIAVAYLNMDDLKRAEKYARRAVEIAPEYEIGREVLDGIESLQKKN